MTTTQIIAFLVYGSVVMTFVIFAYWRARTLRSRVTASSESILAMMEADRAKMALAGRIGRTLEPTFERLRNQIAADELADKAEFNLEVKQWEYDLMVDYCQANGWPTGGGLQFAGRKVVIHD